MPSFGVVVSFGSSNKHYTCVLVCNAVNNAEEKKLGFFLLQNRFALSLSLSLFPQPINKSVLLGLRPVCVL